MPPNTGGRSAAPPRLVGGGDHPQQTHSHPPAGRAQHPLGGARDQELGEEGSPRPSLCPRIFRGFGVQEGRRGGQGRSQSPTFSGGAGPRRQSGVLTNRVSDLQSPGARRPSPLSRAAAGPPGSRPILRGSGRGDQGGRRSKSPRPPAALLLGKLRPLHGAASRWDAEVPDRALGADSVPGKAEGRAVRKGAGSRCLSRQEGRSPGREREAGWMI